MHSFHAWLDQHETLKLAMLLVGIVAPSTLGMSAAIEANSQLGFIASGGWLAFWMITRWRYLAATND